MGRKRSSSDPDFEAQVCAYLLSSGLSQGDIAIRTNHNQSTISKLIKTAINNKWLNVQVYRSFELSDEERMRQVRLRCFPGWDTLINVLTPKNNTLTKIRNVRIFESGPQGKEAEDEEGYNSRLEQFGRAAAGRVRELLPGMSMTAISWGKTLSFMCKHITNIDKSKIDHDQIRFVPSVGESLNYTDPNLSSSYIAAEIHRALYGEKGSTTSLGAVAACIPVNFNRSSGGSSRAGRKSIGTSM